MSPKYSYLAILVVVVAWVAHAASPVVADSTDELARRLTAMRVEVETRSSELTELKTDTANQLRSLARQKADLEVELEREKVRIAKLRSALGKKQQAIVARSTDTKDLEPIFEAALASLTNHVKTSLPFRRDDRLAALGKIDEQRKTGVLSTERALARLWSFIEDELRMTRENGLFRQTITLGDQELLVDVVRLGMVMIFFRTEDGAFGHTEMHDGTWRFTEVEGSKDKRALRTLFDSFKKQIRVGFFSIPNALPPRGEK